MKKILGLLVTGLCTLNSAGQATSNLTLTSGNTELNSHFEWAKNRALDLVITGKSDYTETAYWGSYAHNKSYCIRDITHQSEAGHLLGLDEENFYMMKQFAKSTKNPTTRQKNWVSWKFDFYGNELRFTRELPSPFDAVQRCYENYLWSGNDRWINDTELNYFYDLTLNYTVQEFDKAVPGAQIDLSLLGNGVVGITESQDGIASYHEFQNEKLYEAGDSFGSQYQATLAYAKILKAQGKTAESEEMFQRAANLKTHFETNWYSITARRYIRGFEPNGHAQTNWGHENSFFLVLKKMIEQGTDKGQDYIDFVHVSTMNKPINIEAQTYYAEAFYNNEQNHLGWHWLLNVMRSHNVYPEVAYMCVYNTVGGLLGVRADAPNNTFFTIPRLTKAVPWVQAAHIPIGKNDVTVRHDGSTSTTATNNSSTPITWEAQFYGTHPQLIVNGSNQAAQQKKLNGKTISFVFVTLSNNNPVTVSVPAATPGDFVYLTDMTPTNTTGTIYPETNTESLIMMVRNDYFTKGFSTQNGTEVTYDVSNNSLFKAKVGVDRKISGTMNFQVWGDGSKLYETGNMTEKDNYKPITVNIVGVSELKLVAIGSGGKVSADWADAGIVKAPNADFILEFLSMEGDDNGDGLVDPGETIDLKVKITNAGVTESREINLSCDTWSNDPSYITITNGTGNIGTLAVGASVEKTLSVSINNTTPRQSPLEFTFKANDGAVEGSVVKTFTTPYPIFNYNLNGLGDETAEDGELSAGETASFDLSLENIGNGITNAITATCEVITGAQYVDISQAEANKTIDPVAAGTTTHYTHEIKVKDEVLGGTELKFKFVINDGIDKKEIIKRYQTAKPDFKIDFAKLESKNNGMPMVETGYQSDYTINVINKGNGPSGSNTTISVSTTGPNASLVTINTPSFNVGSMLANTEVAKVINFSVNATAQTNDIIELKIIITDGTYSKTKIQKFIVGTVCVSDMPFSYSQGSYDVVYRDSKVMSSYPIKLGGATYAKGLGVHAKRTIHIELNGLYKRFTSIVGIDDSSGAGSVKFNIYDENDVALYTGNLLEGRSDGPSATESIDIDVTGVKTLKLVVTNGDLNGIDSDHADWGNPQLTLAGNSDDSEAPTIPENLAVDNITINSAVLNWTASTDNIGVTGYNVYLNDVIVKTIPETTFSLNNLAPNTQYKVYITAKDAATNTSAATSPVIFNTLDDGTAPKKIWIEAESASTQSSFSPFTVVEDADASNGKFIEVPNNTGDHNMGSVIETNGLATYNFNLAGTVNIWLRVYTPALEDDSFWLKLDNSDFEKQNDTQASTGWTWIKWQETNLSEGNHTISLAAREDGAMIDRFLITNDLTLIPTGKGDLSTALSDEIDTNQLRPEKVIVYPNPTHGLCKIDLGSHQDVVLQLIDGSGSVVKMQQYTNQKVIDLDFSSLTAGTYYARLVMKDRSIVKQIVYIK